MDNFKGNFLNVSIFLHPQIPVIHTVISRPILTNPIRQWKAYLFCQFCIQFIHKMDFMTLQ